MHDPPHGLLRRRIAGQPGDHMPVEMGHLVAKQLAVDLHSIEHDGQRSRDFRDFLYELAAFFPCEVEQLGRMTLEYQHGPSRKELVVMKIRDSELKLCNFVVLRRPLPCADFTGHQPLVSKLRGCQERDVFRNIRTLNRYCLGSVACLFECFLLFFQPAFSTTCMLIHDEPVLRLESLPELGDIRNRCVLWSSVFQRNTSIRIEEYE